LDLTVDRKELEFLFSHFEPPATPRRYSTALTKNKQFIAYSVDDMIRRFEETDNIDCKVNAYNYLGSSSSSSGGGGERHTTATVAITTTRADAAEQIQQKALSEPAPTIIFIDLDDRKALKSTLTKIKTVFVDSNLEPTTIDSGNGYQIVLPLETDPAKYPCPIENPEDKDRFIPGRSSWIANILAQDYKYGIPGNLSPANLFLRFAEDFLTNGKADIGHNPSVRSCMVRVPGSYNSKCIAKKEGGGGIDSEVKIVTRWDGKTKGHILFLFNHFYYHIQEMHVKRERMMKKARQNRKRLEFNKNRPFGVIGDRTIFVDSGVTELTHQHQQHYNDYWYIDLLLQIQIDDFRKRAISLLFAPYFIKIKKMPFDIAEKQILDWLDRCNTVRLLDFDAIEKTQQAVYYARDKGYLPLGEVKFKEEAPDLFTKLSIMGKELREYGGGN
jgi:hypothetical protein